MQKYVFIPAAIAVALAFTLSTDARGEDSQQTTTRAAALSVNVTKPEVASWPVTIPASGRLAAWQEAVISAEVSGLRITGVNADVGSAVKKGDLLVQFDPKTSQAELDQQKASVDKAQAELDQAVADADRARGLTGSGALSNQQTTQYLITERTAKAELASARASLASAQLTLDRTKVYAIDDGVISSRSASLGKVVNAGDELFKLIRQNRVEWNAELPVKRLADVKEGTKAIIATPAGDVHGEVRLISPTSSTDNGRVIVYVALHPDAGMPQPKTGVLVSGHFEFAQTDALTVPASAVTLRDGFSYIFIMNPSQQDTVLRKRVDTGRRQGDRVEILSGIDKADSIVASGGAFLADGSVVRVVGAAEVAEGQAAK